MPCVVRFRLFFGWQGLGRNGGMELSTILYCDKISREKRDAPCTLADRFTFPQMRHFATAVDRASGAVAACVRRPQRPWLSGAPSSHRRSMHTMYVCRRREGNKPPTTPSHFVGPRERSTTKRLYRDYRCRRSRRPLAPTSRVCCPCSPRRSTLTPRKRSRNSSSPVVSARSYSSDYSPTTRSSRFVVCLDGGGEVGGGPSLSHVSLLHLLATCCNYLL